MPYLQTWGVSFTGCWNYFISILFNICIFYAGHYVLETTTDYRVQRIANNFFLVWKLVNLDSVLAPETPFLALKQDIVQTPTQFLDGLLDFNF